MLKNITSISNDLIPISNILMNPDNNDIIILPDFE